MSDDHSQSGWRNVLKPFEGVTAFIALVSGIVGFVQLLAVSLNRLDGFRLVAGTGAPSRAAGQGNELAPDMIAVQ